MLQQIRRFGLVGLCATALHVSVAYAAQAGASLPPQLANTAGFVSAFLFSYFGHLRYTFGKKAHARVYFLRFIALSGFGFLLSSAIVHLVTRTLGLTFPWALAFVALLVPTSTFVLARFWAFSGPETD